MSQREGSEPMRSPPVLSPDELDVGSPCSCCRVGRRCCLFACTNVINVVGVNIAIAVNAASINARPTRWPCSTSPRSQ